MEPEIEFATWIGSSVQDVDHDVFTSIKPSPPSSPFLVRQVRVTHPQPTPPISGHPRTNTPTPFHESPQLQPRLLPASPQKSPTPSGTAAPHTHPLFRRRLRISLRHHHHHQNIPHQHHHPNTTPPNQKWQTPPSASPSPAPPSSPPTPSSAPTSTSPPTSPRPSSPPSPRPPSPPPPPTPPPQPPPSAYTSSARTCNASAPSKRGARSTRCPGYPRTRRGTAPRAW